MKAEFYKVRGTEFEEMIKKGNEIHFCELPDYIQFSF